MRNLISVPILVLSAVLAVGTETVLAGQVATNGVEQPVSLKRDITVQGPMLHLGDLFDGLGEQAEIAIAKAPAPGSQIRLTAKWLYRLARAHNLAWQPLPGSEYATIRRDSQMVTQREISAIVVEAMEHEGLGDDLDLVFDDPGFVLHLPAGAAPELQVAGISFDPRSDRLAAKILAHVEGEETIEAILRGRAYRMTEVPVLRHRVGPGEVISEQDLTWERVALSRLGRTTLTDPAEIVGKSVRRSVRPGRQLRKTDVQEPVVVAKNALVTIRLDTAFMRLTAQGRALESGGLGDVVRVLNTKSKAQVFGLVTGPNTVQVGDAATFNPHLEASR